MLLKATKLRKGLGLFIKYFENMQNKPRKWLIFIKLSYF